MVDNAIDLLRHVPPALVDQQTVHSAMRALARQGRLSDILKWYKWYKFGHDSYMLDIVVRASLQCSRHRFAWAWVSYALRRSIVPHSSTLLTLYRCSVVPVGLRPPSTLSTLPAAPAVTLQLISAFIVACGINNGGADDAHTLSIAEDVWLLALITTRQPPSTILECLPRRFSPGFPEIVLQLLILHYPECQDLISRVLRESPCSTRTLNILLHSFRLKNDLTAALSLLDNSRVPIDLCTINTLMTPSATLGNSLRTFRLWKGSTDICDHYTISILALACGRDANRGRGARLALMAYALSYRLPSHLPPMFAIPSILIALELANMSDIARMFFDELTTKRGVVPDMALFNTVNNIRFYRSRLINI
uniref:Uncharacterized protein n=2 Tax=Spongospora subterranea TaxID=70186 RepID=A0A0H5QI14_9EUKA|eukprot:CRZ01618.1 hypothetical protein [Spongospora subterranea]